MSAGVYIARDESGVVLYVGASRNPEQRVRNHHDKPWWPSVAAVDFEHFGSEVEAFEREAQLIVELQPTVNARAGRTADRLNGIPAAVRILPRDGVVDTVVTVIGGEAELARWAGMSQSTVSRVRRGKTDPSPQFIASLMDVTGLPFEDLFVIVKDVAA